MTCVLGAPGCGKSTVAPLLRNILATHVIVDWDAYMEPASALAERDIRRTPSTWQGYRSLVRSVVETVRAKPLVMFGVCTPDELEGWPSFERWILLDCSDGERRRRLHERDDAEVREALADAARYRRLNLPIIDTTDRPPEAVADALAERIRAR